MANITKPFKIILLLMLFFLGNIASIKSQTLLDLDISVNGQIHDVTYSENIEAFILVGEFSSITYNGNSQAVNNFAVLKLDTLGFGKQSILSINSFSLNPDNYFDCSSPNGDCDFNGPINAVESTGDYLIFGGGFDTPKYHLAKYYFDGGDYKLDTSFYPIDPSYNFFPVNDIDCMGNVVTVNNVFELVDDGFRTGAFKFNVSGNYIYPNFGDGSSSWYAGGEMHKILQRTETITTCCPLWTSSQNNTFLSGSNFSGANSTDNNILKLNYNTVDGGFSENCNPPAYNDDISYDMCLINDSVVAYIKEYNAYSNTLNFFNFYDGSCYTVNNINKLSTASVENYNGWLYCVGTNSTTPTIRGYNFNNYYYNNGDLNAPQGYDWQVTMNANIANNFSGDENIKIEENFMFVSLPGLTSVDGQTRNGLAIFSLRPSEITGLTQSKDFVCTNEENVIYEVDVPEYTHGFIWNYTGNDVNINGTGLATDTTYMGDPNNYLSMPGNQISIDFGPNFTSGNLEITPISLNGTEADTYSFPISAHPTPDISTLPDSTLTCARDSLKLFGNSTFTNIELEWEDENNNVFQVDSLVTYDAGDFVLKVTELDNNCYNFDTVTVTIDTLKPNVTVPFTEFSLTCADTAITLIGTTSSTHGEISWALQNDPTIYADSMLATTPATHVMYVMDTLNGCTDSAYVLGVLDVDPPDIGLENYVSVTNGLLDTVNCFNDTLSLIPTSSEQDVIGYWTDTVGSNNFLTDTLYATGAGLYYLYGIDTVRGCDQVKAVLLSENFQQPDILLDSTLALNCSVDSVQLEVQSTYTNINIAWEDDLQNSFNDLDYINTQGWYYATIQRQDNGCEMTDSVLIDYSPTILVNIGEDTLACDGKAFQLSANVVGSFNNLNYSWNNGDNTASVNYTYNGNHPVVQVSDNSGCAGTDTLFVIEPPDPNPDFLSVLPCGDGSGSITVTPTNGLAPLSYSLDGQNFQTNNVFNGLNPGPQQVWISDSINCVYAYNTTIDNTPFLPEVNFLLPSYNAPMDSIVLIDISSPQADSISWNLPNSFVNIEEETGMITIAANDTGAFNMQMTAYYGNCEITTSKMLYVSEDYIRLDDEKAGINNIDLYPNPNQGDFTVEVDFGSQQRAAVYVYNVSGNVYYENVYELTNNINEDIQLNNLVPGNYVLKVIGEFDSAQITFVVQ